MWRNLCGAIYVAQAMWYNICANAVGGNEAATATTSAATDTQAQWSGDGRRRRAATATTSAATDSQAQKQRRRTAATATTSWPDRQPSPEATATDCGDGRRRRQQASRTDSQAQFRKKK